MIAFKVTSDGSGNLDSAIDQILEGALDEFAELAEVKREIKRSGRFAADPQKTITFIVHFRAPPPPSLTAKLMAEIRTLVGPTADIEQIDHQN